MGALRRHNRPLGIDLNNPLNQARKLADDFLRLLPNLVLAAVILAIAYVLSRYSAKLVRTLTHRAGQSAGVALLLGRFSTYIVFTIGILIALSTVFPSFQARDLIQLLGISGVAVGFAFKDIFQNFLAGLIILISRPFRIGDTIAVKGYEGVVEDIQTRATMIRTADGQRVVVPNTVLFSEEVKVVTAYESRRTELELGINYYRDLALARQTIFDAVSGVEGVLGDPAPDVLAYAFADVRTTLRVHYWTASDANGLAIRDAVISAIKHALDEAGIDLTITAAVAAPAPTPAPAPASPAPQPPVPQAKDVS